VNSATATTARRRRVDLVRLESTAVFALAFGLIFYLGMREGGYDPLVRDEVGIAIWWGLLLGVTAGVLPRAPLGRLSIAALGLLAALALWSGLSAIWADSPERAVADTGKLVTYLGVFALAVLGLRASTVRRAVEGAAAAIALQRALVLELDGRLEAARAAAAHATEAAPTDWRAWLVRSRLEANLELPRAALRSYRKARRLNPHSPLFATPK
jgi:tetratricopeptide (TPR) repeat protein